MMQRDYFQLFAKQLQYRRRSNPRCSFACQTRFSSPALPAELVRPRSALQLHGGHLYSLRLSFSRTESEP
eukprot:scaffold702_cov387-Prasinococcus_capsulatus_cf.AAC.1